MMRKNSDLDISELFRQRTPITDAVNRDIREAIRRHKLLDQPIVVWRDGKVV